MASIKLSETKDGRRFFQICVSRGYGKSPYKTRWYWPDGWSKRTAEREAAKQAAAFELACQNGEVLNRAQEREKAAQEAAEAAKLKTLRQYADGVFMPTKEATFSENARSSYRMFLDKHIFPVLGDVLLTEVTPAMISKLLVDFQRAGYAHATAVLVSVIKMQHRASRAVQVRVMRRRREGVRFMDAPPFPGDSLAQPWSG